MSSTCLVTVPGSASDNCNKALARYPYVSVIMPVRNEEAYINKSLGSVLAQDYPSDRMEVIVVDGMSTDSTRDIVRSYQQTHPYLHLLDNPEGIAPTAMNRGMHIASGEIILRVDGHCEISTDHLTRCVTHILIQGVDGVGGSVETIGETAVAQIIALGMSSTFGVGGASFRTVQGCSLFADTVPFPAYTRAAIQDAGPYDEELVRNQDDEYNYRLRKLGKRILLAGDVRSRYYSRSSLWRLCRQYFQYGYWKVRVMQKHPRQMRARQFIPALLVATLVLSVLASPFSSVLQWCGIVLAATYVAANILASVWTSRRVATPYAVLLPLVYAILHFSYGAGFLVGLVRFAPYWLKTR